MEHFTFASYWERGDAISHGVAYLLLAMSLASWFFILWKGWASWRTRRAAPAVQAFWDAPTVADGVALMAARDQEGIFAAVAQAASGQLARAKAGSIAAEMGRSEQATRVLRDAIHASTTRLETGLTLLASIASTAPFVGLLGTVWGIYHALAAVSSSGTVQIDKVAGPVGEALIMTGVGLVVAIPAVLAYNGFNRINRITLSELDAFAHDLHAYLTKG
ncbi:MotA/TolQ/ExbB proton channel family protein [Pseudoduganella sp. DS3]|uniref:Biopolymer transport protein ExbB n=1 Tax=Pseudoduganella guangdongensis TaxID=2692179 RepID=A0A6N9HAX9_9BURK|nr:MotA/TolQ/ExbB proton channel family protein [Pseudoduganella guangdongensis]MYN00596.1 MotA/TolQ/ExbB proton channel family protein [Pseudoduganella guangdongensis]